MAKIFFRTFEMIFIAVLLLYVTSHDVDASIFHLP